MFSSLLRPKHRNRRVDPDRMPISPSPSAGPAFQKRFPRRHATADFTEADDDDEDTQNEALNRQYEDEEEEEEEDGGEDVRDETNTRRPLPVLPLFSASYLGR